MEQHVLDSADKLVVTSQHTKLEFSSKTKTPITVITNGYDTYPSHKIEKDTTFSLSHIGSLLSERNPLVLWEVLSELISENAEFAESFQLNLVGVVSDAVVDSITAFGLADYSKVIGYVNHNDAISYQRQSQLLLLIEIDSEDTKAIIPGKLYQC